MKVLTMAEAAELLHLKNGTCALRLLRDLEKVREVKLVERRGGQGNGARYVTTESMLKRGIPELFRGREDPSVIQRIERLEARCTRMQARIGELARKT